MTTRRSEFLQGCRGVSPILLGVVPFGLIYGVSARGAGIPALAAQTMSFIIFGGSAQFVIAQLVGAGVPGGIIILTAVIINLRHALYSASVAPYLKGLLARWKWLLAYVLTDECYAVTITHYHQGDNAGRKHWYFFGADLTLWATWQASTAAGILLGTQIPSSWSLDFTLPLTFIIPSVRPRPSGLGICALVLVWGLDGVLDILRRIC